MALRSLCEKAKRLLLVGKFTHAPILRLLTWLRHALLERAFNENSSGGKPDPELLRRRLYFSLLRTELEMAADG